MDDWKASSVVGVLLFPMWTPLTVVSNDVESLAILGWNRLCCPTAILLMTIPIYMGPIVQGSTVDWCLWWVVQTGQINKQQNLSLTFLEHRGSNLMYRDFFQRIFLAYIGSSIVIFLRNYCMIYWTHNSSWGLGFGCQAVVPYATCCFEISSQKIARHATQYKQFVSNVSKVKNVRS